jgi:hypothetical protein
MSYGTYIVTGGENLVESGKIQQASDIADQKDKARTK